MPTYVYETIPSQPDEKPEQFEIQQSMRDAPLKTHPENGKPVRRIISGGYGYLSKGAEEASGGHCCCGGCGCQH